MHLDSRRWSPARLIWRWGHLFWIGPLLGLLTGLALVFVFLKENETDQVYFDVGSLPRGIELEPFITDLRSELASDDTLIEIQHQLAKDGGFFQTPKWWLRKRIRLESIDTSGGINMLFTHHSPSGRERLSESFEETAKKMVPRIRAKHVGEWLEKIDARLAEIRLAVKAAEAQRELRYRSDIPFIDESEQLENDREGLLMEQPYLGFEVSLPGSFGGAPPWWKSPPKWALLIFKCAGCGIMAVFPLVIILEKLRPMRLPPGEVATGARP